MTILDAVAHDTTVAKTCFLDGIIDCDMTIACSECRSQELSWNDSCSELRHGMKDTGLAQPSDDRPRP